MNTDEQERRSAVHVFFGGSPGGVIVRLILVSLFVGLVMSWFGLSPMDLFSSLERMMRDAWANSGDVLRAVFTYVLTGAAVVVPIWLIIRLMRVGRGR